VNGLAVGPGGSLAIINIGTLLTGELEAPLGEAEALLVVDGRIARLGDNAAMAGADQVIDAAGSSVAPGLIDSHCHVTLGDYSPRQNVTGFLDSYVHGGITQVISAGEIHVPGRPFDAAGVKALAVLAQRSWTIERPNGMKVLGGAIIIEPSLTPEDFAEVAAEGVRLAKFGFGRFAKPTDGASHIRAAQAQGILVMSHSGGASIPGSQPITAEDLLELGPDVCGHINGGPTSLDKLGVERLVRESGCALQLVQAGSLRSALEIARYAVEQGASHRLVLGSDTPTGTGVMPLGVIKTIAELSSLGGFAPEQVWAWATGVTADVYGLEAGRIAVGRPADICVLDAPWGSMASDAIGALARGDIPGISAVVIDGVVRTLRSRNTPMATRQVSVSPGPSPAR
jgi:enamidase